MIKVEIYSDFVCPFCYIGETELDNAAKATGLNEHLDVSYRSFELDPTAPNEQTLTMKDLMKEKTGGNQEQADQMIQSLIDRANSLGLEYNYDNLMAQNTYKAHRVGKLAKEEGKELEFHDTLFKAVFTDNYFLPDNEQLLELSKKIGLDEEKVKEVLENESAYKNQVEEDKTLAREIGISGVPFFVINDKYAVQGAQPQAAFEQALKKVADEEGIKPKLQTFDFQAEDNAGICGPDGCSI